MVSQVSGYVHGLSDSESFLLGGFFAVQQSESRPSLGAKRGHFCPKDSIAWSHAEHGEASEVRRPSCGHSTPPENGPLGPTVMCLDCTRRTYFALRETVDRAAIPIRVRPAPARSNRLRKIGRKVPRSEPCWHPEDSSLTAGVSGLSCIPFTNSGSLSLSESVGSTGELSGGMPVSARSICWSS